MEEADSGEENRFMLIARLVISEEQTGRDRGQLDVLSQDTKLLERLSSGFRLSPFHTE
jgi:hypothetical protein